MMRSSPALVMLARLKWLMKQRAISRPRISARWRGQEQAGTGAGGGCDSSAGGFIRCVDHLAAAIGCRAAKEELCPSTGKRRAAVTLALPFEGSGVISIRRRDNAARNPR